MLNFRISSIALFSALCLFAVAVMAEENEGANPEDLFKTLDKNSDGKLTKDEVGEERSKFFERLIRVGDTDKNGELSREEFTNGLKPDDKPVAAPGFGGQGSRGNRGNFDPKQMFERLDRNKDGKLTKDEIPEQGRRFLMPLFERLGKDALTLEEFLQARRPNPEQFINRFDKNNDSKVSLDELPEEIRTRIKPLFDRLGKDAVNKEDLEKAFANRPGQDGRPKEGDKRKPDANKKTEPQAAADSRRKEEEQPNAGERRRPEGGPDGFRGPIIFRELDTNNDHKISKEELAKAADLFGKLDKNKNGFLDPSEMFGPPPRRPGGPDGNQPRRPDGNRPEGARPNAKPRDGNTTNKNEQGRPRFGSGEFINRIFEMFDKNKDGKLTKEEAPDRLKENFSQADSNGDGSVDKQELTNRIKARIQEFQKNRADKDKKSTEKK